MTELELDFMLARLEQLKEVERQAKELAVLVLDIEPHIGGLPFNEDGAITCSALQGKAFEVLTATQGGTDA
jgi:hypothetical protein